MNNADGDALASHWLDLWNGDLGLADQIVSEAFLVHAALMSGADEMRGREALKRWVGGTRAFLPDLTFTVQVGPITNEEHLVVRWQARGAYGGGFPGASPKAIGKEIGFTGTDILRVESGLLAEYWVNSDILLLLQQLGVRAIPSMAAATA